MRFPLRVGKSAAYLLAAAIHHGPGIGMRLRAAALGFRGIRHNPDLCGELIVEPMDSVRYFEHEFAWAAVRAARGVRYLDASSPRLLPMAVVASNRTTSADLLNPDPADLKLTVSLARALGIESRIRFQSETITRASLTDKAYDLVTSISVLEHIPDGADMLSLKRLWDSLRPGGRLVLTVPCAPRAYEELVNVDSYGMAPAVDHEFFFGQRFYDEELLSDRVFATCGAPSRMAVFGEARPGVFEEDRAQKNLGLWDAEREPYSVARAWRKFPSIHCLPGVGVVGLEFVKRKRFPS